MTPPQSVLKRKVFKRLPADDLELYWYVKGVWGIRFPRHSCCPEHTPPFKAFADAYFAREPIYVWKASRGYGGKSFMLATLSATESATLGAGVSLLGGSGAQSGNVHDHTRGLMDWPNSPKNTILKDNTYLTTFSNGGWMKALTASQTSVRGPHPERLRLDEIDEMDLAILQAAQGQPMRKRGQNGETLIETNTVMSSTHQYPDKTMHEILLLAKENNWPVYEWCWKCTSNPIDGWLQTDEVERKRREISKRMWETEYDLQEPSFEGRAIDTDAVDAAFKRSLGEFEGEDGCVIRVEQPPEDPHPHGPYVTGVDWAKEKDWTVVCTWRTDEDPWRLVAFKRYNRKPWPVQVTRAEAQWFAYGGKFIHDATGIGNVVSDLLTGNPRHVTDQVLSGRERLAIFNEYISAVENGEVEMPFIEFMYNEHKYVTDDDLEGKGHPPDSFVAAALGWHLRKKKRYKLGAPVPIGMPRQDASLIDQ